MRLHEFEAADIFEGVGIPVPRRGVAETVEEGLLVAGEIGDPGYKKPLPYCKTEDVLKRLIRLKDSWRMWAN